MTNENNNTGHELGAKELSNGSATSSETISEISNDKYSNGSQDKMPKKPGDDGKRDFLFFPWFPSLNFLYNNPIGRLMIGESMRKERPATNGTENVTRNGILSSMSGSSSQIQVALSAPQVQSNQAWREYVEQIPEAKFYRNLLLHGYLMSNKILTGLPSFKSLSDDVTVCSYPKSGTTWTEEMIYLMLKTRSLNVKDLENDPALKVALFERVRHLEVGEPRFHWHRLKKNNRPRLMATHLPFTLLPDDMQTLDSKIIYVIRNPKDVAVSYFYHHQICKLFGHYKGSWDEFVERFMDGHCVYGSWFSHVQGFWRAAQQHPDKVLVIAYEELIVDFRNMARVIGSFLGVDLSEEQLDAIEAHTSFNKMKTNPAVNREVTIIKDIFDMSSGVKFCRKGMIGDWMNHFSTSQSLRMDQLYARWLRDLQSVGQLQGFRLAFSEQEARRMMKDDGRIMLLNS